MITKQEIKTVAADFFRNQPVNRAYLFGSYAKNRADEGSDIDILVEFDHQGEHIGFIRYFLMMEELSKRLRHKVDMVSATGMSKFIGPIIHAEKELLYERTDRT